MTAPRRGTLWILATAVTLVLLAGSALYFYWPAAPSEGTVRVGYMRISPALPFFVAQERQLFAREGVTIEPVPYTAGLNMLDDVVTGRIDASITGPADILLSREIEQPNRFKIYLHAVYDKTAPLYSVVVRADSPIKSTADVKGKTIAVAPGLTNAALLALALNKRHGFVRDADYQIVQVAPGQQLDSIRSGLYDAVVPLEAIGTIASTSPDLRVIEWAPIESTVMSPLPITAFAVSTAALAAKPNAVRRFVAAIHAAVAEIKADEQSTRQFLVAGAGLTAEQAARCGIGRYVSAAEQGVARFQSLADLLAEAGVVKRKVDVSGLYYRP